MAVLLDPVDDKHIGIEDTKELLSTHKFTAEEKDALVKKVKENSQRLLLGIHYEGGRIKKKHNKTHSKIVFQSLAKIVLWKDKKTCFADLAQEDLI